MNHRLPATLRRWARRRRHVPPAPTTCQACAQRPVAAPPDEPLPTVQFQLTRVDDPDGRSVIMAVRGLLAGPALDALHREATTIPPRTTIHLDLTGASILTVPMMRRLESWTDALDDAGRSVRIAGLSPHHPTLRRERHL